MTASQLAQVGLAPFRSRVSTRKTELCLIRETHPEYHNKTITKLFNGNSLYGCYGLAVTIFSLGIIRDAMYANAFSKPQRANLPNAPID